MSKRLTKTLAVIAMALVVLAIAVTPVFADIQLNYDDVNIKSERTKTTTVAETITGQILSVVQVIGVAVAVIMLIVLAIKYISAAPNDKAEIKKHAVVYIVGAVVLFAAAGILEMIKGFATTINEAQTQASIIEKA